MTKMTKVTKIEMERVSRNLRHDPISFFLLAQVLFSASSSHKKLSRNNFSVTNPVHRQH